MLQRVGVSMTLAEFRMSRIRAKVNNNLCCDRDTFGKGRSRPICRRPALPTGEEWVSPVQTSASIRRAPLRSPATGNASNDRGRAARTGACLHVESGRRIVERQTNSWRNSPPISQAQQPARSKASGEKVFVVLPRRHAKIDSTVQYLGIDVDDPLAIAEQVDV